MAVSVPKRLFKKAVDRNLLKRRIREAYRLNKSLLHNLQQEGDGTIRLVIQYQHKEIENYQVIEEGVIRGLSKLAEKLKQKP
jgi:ribonuclease P protein component